MLDALFFKLSSQSFPADMFVAFLTSKEEPDDLKEEVHVFRIAFDGSCLVFLCSTCQPHAINEHEMLTHYFRYG